MQLCLLKDPEVIEQSTIKSFAVKDSLKSGIHRCCVSSLLMLCQGFSAAIFSSFLFLRLFANNKLPSISVSAVTSSINVMQPVSGQPYTSMPQDEVIIPSFLHTPWTYVLYVCRMLLQNINRLVDVLAKI